MKILLLCYEYPPIGGGGGVGAQQYAEGWAAAGHEVMVLTSQARGLAAREVVGGVAVRRVLTWGRQDRATSTFVSMLCYNLTGLLHVLWHRRDFRGFEVINTHFSIPTGPMAWAVAKFLGVPNVLTIIGGDIYDPSKKSSPHRSAFFRAVNRWLINAADRVIAISSDTKRRAEEHYQIRRSIEVINYGFKPMTGVAEKDPAIPVPAGKYSLIAVGRLVERKAFDVLIRAMRLLPEEIHLMLVGDGPQDGVLRALAAETGVAQRVHFMGYCRRELIHGLLRKADCYVLSSMHEGLGIVVQEAMDAALPVVATDNGGQVDLIRPGRNGLLVKVGDDRALAEAIRTVHGDRALARAMRENNRRDIERLYIENNCRLYVDVFGDLTASRHQPMAKVASGHSAGL